MATLNFPDSPSTGDLYTDSNSGFTYEWNGTVWISKDPSSTSNIRELDNISSSFNGSTTSFTLQVGGVNVEPANVQQLIINIGNVMQNAGEDFTVSGSTLTFTTAPSAGLTFFGTILGTKLTLSSVADGSVSPTSITTTSNNYVVGGLTIDESAGIVTAYQFKGDGSELTGVASTDNIVTSTDAIFNANVNIAGSLTVQGTETIINVDELNVQDKTLGIGSTNAPSPTTQNLSGVVLYGQTHINILYENDRAALGISTSVNVAGIVTATTYYGDGSNLTGVGSTLYPLSYHPGISSTSQPVLVANNANKIELKWNYPIKAGTGTIELREGSASGTVKDQFVVGTSNSITIAGPKLTLNPAVGLTTNTNYFVVLPAGAIKSSGDQEQNSVINGYSYTTVPYGLTQLWTSGYDDNGSLGQNDDVSRSSPVQISGDNWYKIGNSNDEIYGIKNDGTLWAWGYNNLGNLGHNDRTYRSSPTQVGTDTTWNYVSKGGSVTTSTMMATKKNGSLWVSGNGANGILGLNDIVQRSSPTQIPGTTWPQDGSAKLANGYRVSMAIKTDGTLWAWGNNEYGNLGINQKGGPAPTSDWDRVSSPMQIGTDTTWKEVSTTAEGGIALKTDGTLWTWGYQLYGEGGRNIATDKLSSPTQVGTDTTWSSITGDGGGRYAYTVSAIKTDGTLWMWGANESGALGQNQNDVHRSSPTQVGSGTDWSYSQGARNYCMASKTDGTLWAWGSTSTGRFGLNLPTPGAVSSPTQIMSDKNFVRVNGTVMDSTSISSSWGSPKWIIKQP